MTDAGPSAGPLARPTAATLWARVRGLLLAPSQEWRLIDAERPTLRELFVRWVLPLTIFFFLAQTIGSMAFPVRVEGVASAPSAVRAISIIFFGTLFMLGGVWATAWIIDRLAPAFGGRRDFMSALKLAAYSGTGLWLSGAFGLFPAISLLGVVGIVSFYTLYRGLPLLMKSDGDRTLPYAACVISACAVLGVVLMTLSGCLAIVGPSPRTAAPVAASVIPAAAPVKAADPAAPIDLEKFRRLMPDAIPGRWVRAGMNIKNSGAGGISGRTLEAVYERDHQRLFVRLIDVGPEGAAKMVADQQALRPARQDADGHVAYVAEGERFRITEESRNAGVARAITIVRNRVALALEGTGGVTMDELTNAQGLVDMERVDQVARGL
ncbi:MAG: Yip1 family protein [Alphaproteobacteria bacterium]|nr:Yip1 family protein [Alphaproteobacteria bacterium]